MLPTMRELLRVAEDIGVDQAGVVSRRQLYEAGCTRGMVRAQVRAHRWRRSGGHGIVLHTGPLSPAGQHWAALIEAGPRAHLDGASALLASGLQHFTPERIRVSVPKGARIRVRRTTSFDLRETRRWRPDDVMPSGIPRSRPAVAAIRAALWARSDRQARLLPTMAVQQGLCTVEDLAVQLLRIKRDMRRGMLGELLVDLAGGARSLGELDVRRGCRERGLPEPDAQVLRRTSKGNYYLDFRWKRWGVVVEVDGIQHAWVQHLVGDALRHNTIAISGDVVLRLPVIGLRLCPGEFFAQIAQALRSRGCRLDPAA